MTSTVNEALNKEELERRRVAPVPAEWPQGLQVAAAGAGGGGGGLDLPIDVQSPSQQLRLQIDLSDQRVRVRLSHSCGAEVLLRVLADGQAAVRILDCSRQGLLLTPNGMQEVTVVEDPDTGEETETPTQPQPLAPITVTGCVNGQTKQIVVFGYIVP